MDKIDKKILEILQTNAHISNQELADMVALSPSPCLRRVKLLEEQGYIRKHVALLNPARLGLNITVMVLVGLNNHDPEVMSNFEQSITYLPEIVQCYLITGQAADYVLKVMMPDLKAYQNFLLNKLTCIKGVQTVHSSFVLQEICDSTALPLDHL